MKLWRIDLQHFEKHYANIKRPETMLKSWMHYSKISMKKFSYKTTMIQSRDRHFDGVRQWSRRTRVFSSMRKASEDDIEKLYASLIDKPKCNLLNTAAVV